MDPHVNVVEHTCSDRHSLVHTGASSQFIDQNKRSRCRYTSSSLVARTVLEDSRCLADLRVESTAVVQNVVRTADTTEDLVNHADVSSSGGNKTPHLTQNHAESNRPKERCLASHIRSGDHARTTALLAY